MSPTATTPEREWLPAHLLDIRTGTPEVFIHPDEARRFGLHPLDRVEVQDQGSDRHAPAIVNVAPGLVQPGIVGVSVELATRIGVETSDPVTLTPSAPPRSVEAIKRKLDGETLTAKDISAVIRDIAAGRLTTIEVTAWAVGIHVYGMATDETVACIEAMVEAGERIHFSEGPVVDVHSIGGVPGNKYAPLAVPIVASFGVKIPKTSSRAISSACGTADFMEVVTPVALSADRVKAITEDVGGTLAWGGGVNLAPADDEIIRVEYPLSLDPPSQLLASVLAKKIAVGAEMVLIDIPIGNGAKVPDEAAAHQLGHQFIEVGRRLGVEVQCLVSRGDQPLGRAIGPILEIREALTVLEGASEPAPLIDKACTLSGRLLEMANVAEPGQGHGHALDALRSGKALEKFDQIILAQGAPDRVRAEDLEPGPEHRDMMASADGPVISVDNRRLVRIARAAGSPRDKGAGLMLHCAPGDTVRQDRPLYTIYAENEHRLEAAEALARTLKPFKIRSGEVLGFID